MKKTSLVTILLAVFIRPQMATAGAAGSTRFDFLNLDTNARAVAMGGAYTALAAGAGALHYNPAGLAATKRSEAAFMHNQYFQGITQEYLGYASPKGWGADFNYLSFGDTRETTLSNPTGAGLGKVGLQDMALGFGFGREVRGGLLAGAGLKIVRESIAGVSASGFMLDGGLLWSVPGAKGFDLGLAVKNLGPDIKYDGGNEPLPLGIRAGAGYNLSIRGIKTTFALDAHQSRQDSNQLQSDQPTWMRLKMMIRTCRK